MKDYTMLKFVIKTLEYWTDRIPAVWERVSSWVYAILIVTAMVLVMNGAI